jgi:glycine/D-amino acid oxidase-like deaminating enzyme
MPMAMHAMRIWRGLAEEIGEDVGYEQGGCIFAARDDKELDNLAAWLDVAKEYGVDTRVIEGDGLRRQVPGAALDWRGALYTQSDGRAEPHKAVPAIARALRAKGVPVLESCAVRGLDIDGGRVAGIVTEHGIIRTSTVLCSAGAWTSMFCRSLGIDLPQLRVRGTVVRTAPAEQVLNGNVYDIHLGIRRRQDGGYSVAHGLRLDHSITPSTFRFATKFLPALRQEIGGLRLSIGGDFIEEWRTPKRWALDTESPFESGRYAATSTRYSRHSQTPTSWNPGPAWSRRRRTSYLSSKPATKSPDSMSQRGSAVTDSGSAPVWATPARASSRARTRASTWSRSA